MRRVRVLWVLVALLVLLPIASAQAAPPTCTSFFRAAEDDGRPTGGSVGCRGPLDVPLTTRARVAARQHGTLTGVRGPDVADRRRLRAPRATPRPPATAAPDSFTVRATVAGESVEHVVQLTVVAPVDDPPACNSGWTNVPLGPGPVQARRR